MKPPLFCSRCPYTGGCFPSPGGWCEQGLVQADTRYPPEQTPTPEALAKAERLTKEWVEYALQIKADVSLTLPFEDLDRRIALALTEQAREIEQLRGDWVEWLCQRENVVHPYQQGGGLLQQCPSCGEAMMPTSQNLRELARLREERAVATRLAADVLRLRDQLEIAWGVIANAGGGDWSRETAEWQHAAARWRDGYFSEPLRARAAAQGEP